MRRMIIVLACVLIAPLAFAQAKKGKVQQPTANQPSSATETVTSTLAGTIRSYQAGRTMVLNSTHGPVSFALSKTATIVNADGNPVTSDLKPGQDVRVYYTGTGTNRAVEKIVVED